MTRQREDNPLVIISVTDARDQRKFEQERIKGKFLRVWPMTARQILTMQMLEHRKEKFAPADGGGILVEIEAFRRYFA
jgi:hypothetical protein